MIVENYMGNELWKLGHRVYRWKGPPGWWASCFTSKRAAKKYLRDFHATF